MIKSRLLILGAAAVSLTGALALGAVGIANLGASQTQVIPSAAAAAVTSSTGERVGGQSETQVSFGEESEPTAGQADELLEKAPQPNTDETLLESSGREPSPNTDAPANVEVPVAGEPSSRGEVSSSEPTDPPAPVEDRAVWTPVTPIQPEEEFPLLNGGPILSSPTWSCGSKIIFSVTAVDPNAVVRVWGSYYVGRSKTSFNSSNSSGNIWSTTIFSGADPVTSLVVYAKDGAGNSTTLAVGSLCA